VRPEARPVAPALSDRNRLRTKGAPYSAIGSSSRVASRGLDGTQNVRPAAGGSGRGATGILGRRSCVLGSVAVLRRCVGCQSQGGVTGLRTWMHPEVRQALASVTSSPIPPIVTVAAPNSLR
jgi:hypothetical protein